MSTCGASHIIHVLLINIYTLYQALGVPCFLGGMARGLLGRNSDLHIRQRRRDALKEADLVILAGMVNDSKEKILAIRSCV